MNCERPDPHRPSGIASAALLVLSSLLVLSCKQAPPDSSAAEIPAYPVVLPQIREVDHERSFVAEIQSREHLELKAHAAGLIEEIHVEEGARVVRGQPLFTVAGQQLEGEWKRAAAAWRGNVAEAKMAEIESLNTQLLFDKAIVSKAELELAGAKLEAARAKVEESQAELAQAELMRSYSKIVAPAHGFISRIPHKEGSRVEEGEVLTRFSKEGDVYAYFHVSERDSFRLMQNPDLTAKDAASLVLADGSDYPLRGWVDAWDTVVEKETGNITFRARFPNPDHLLKHGASCRIILRTKVADALVIPQKSTFEVQHKLCVYVLGAGDVVRMRTIVPRFRLPNGFVIESGLERDDRILYEGIQLVKEGETIAAALKDPDDVSPL